MAGAVKLADVDFRQIQVGNGDVSRYRYAVKLCTRNHARGASGGQPAEVRAHAGLLDEGEIACDGGGLGGFRDTGQAQPGGYLAFMRDNGTVALYEGDYGQLSSTPTGIDPTAAAFTLRVEAEGTSIRVYVNDTEFLNETNETFSSGYVGLASNTVTTFIDDVIVDDDFIGGGTPNTPPAASVTTPSGTFHPEIMQMKTVAQQVVAQPAGRDATVPLFTIEGDAAATFRIAHGPSANSASNAIVGTRSGACDMSRSKPGIAGAPRTST